MEPEDAARVILDGLRAGKDVVRFPRRASWAMAAVRLLPPRLLDALYRVPVGHAARGNRRPRRLVDRLLED